MGRLGGEGAAFFVFREAHPSDRWKVTLTKSNDRLTSEIQVEDELGYLGTAGLVVALARRLLSGESASLRLGSEQILSISE